MGHNTAADLANGVEEGWASLDQALAVHLVSNHYPPLPLSFIPVALATIESANEEAFEERVIWPTDGAEPLPRLAVREGTFNGKPRFTTSVAEAIEILHLDSFIGVSRPTIDLTSLIDEVIDENFEE